MGKNVRRRSKRRFIFHDKTKTFQAKIYLVYFYTEESVTLMTDGPFEDQSAAIDCMKNLLSKGKCAWMVAYNG